MSVAQPVRRDDGMVYASSIDAADATMREWGVLHPERGQRNSVATNIRMAARKLRGTSYGHSWEKAPDYYELLELVRDMRDVILSMPMDKTELGDLPERWRLL